jgi:hypothetical protein
MLDLDFYYSNRSMASLTLDDGVRYVSMSLAEFVLEPRPWAAKSTSERLMAVQQVAWYGLAALAPIGLLAGVRRDSFVTMLLACNVLVGAAVIAPNSGNIGTLIRHRDMIVPFVVWLSSLGAVSVCSRLMSGRKLVRRNN